MLVTDDITLYNKRYDRTAGKDIWFRTYIRGVTWKGGTLVNSGKGSLEEQGNISVRIPVTADAMGKVYAVENAWRGGGMPEFWTLQNGDIIFRGIVDTPAETDDMSQLLDEHLEAVTVLHWADNRDPRNSAALHHWRVVGK